MVGALGDFVVAGSGSLASRVTDAAKEFRGASFATGQTLLSDTFLVAYGINSVFESFEDNAAGEYKPALACQMAQSRNYILI